MNLKNYLSINRKTVNRGVFAENIGVSRVYVSHICSGFRLASIRLCLAIERETSGAVTCEDLRPDVDWAYLRGTAKPPKKAA